MRDYDAMANEIRKMPREDRPPVISTKVAARLGSWSDKFVRDRIEDGSIAGIKVGRSWRVYTDPFFEMLGID